MFKVSGLRPKWRVLVVLCAGLGVALLHFCIGMIVLRFCGKSVIPAQQQAESIWLPGYRVVIQAKPLAGLAKAETSGLSWSPLSNTLFAVTGRIPKLVELSLEGEVLREVELRGFLTLKA